MEQNIQLAFPSRNRYTYKRISVQTSKQNSIYQYKIKQVRRSRITFGIEDETPEHLFVSCHLSKQFWEEISHWLQLCNIHGGFYFSNPVNVMFGLLDISDNFEPLNHIILIAKQTIFFCRRKNIVPSLNIFLAQLKKLKSFLLNKKQITPAPGKMEKI